MAASAGSIEAGRAFVRIGLEGVEAAKAQMASFGNALKTLGAALSLNFAVGKVQDWVSGFAEAGRELYLTSRQMQMSVEELQEMKKAGQELGIEFESMQAAVNKVRNYVAELATSGQQTNDTMRELSLTLSDVANLSDLDRIQLFGERIRGLGNAAMTARIGRQIFGRGGVAIAASAADLGPAREHARGGPMLTKEQVRDAFELSQSMRAFDRAVSGVGKAIGAALVPGFRAVYDYITPIVKSVRNWVVANQTLVQKIALIGGIIVGVSAALIAMATTWGLIGMVISGIAAVFTGIWGVIAAIAGIVAFAFTPFGAALIAIIAIDAYLLHAFGVLEKIGQLGAGLGDVFDQAFDGIKDAILAGELGLAWDIVLAGMNLAWLRFNQNLSREFGINLLDAFDAIRIAWVDLVAIMRASWALLAFQVNAVGVGIQQAAAFLQSPLQASIDAANGTGPFMASLNNLTTNLAQIEIERRNQQAGIFGELLSRPGLGADAMVAQIDLDNLREAASIAASQAEARRAADIGPAARGLEEFASQKDSARGTFNRDVLWGFGSTPMQRIERQLERLELLIPIRAGIEQVLLMEVS